MAGEGFYSMIYTGMTGLGFGMLILDTGLVIGADAAGGQYDGTYTYNQNTGLLDLSIKMTVPAGTWLVTGVPAQSTPYSVPFVVSLPRDLGAEQPLDLSLPFGTVKVVFKKVRGLP